MQLVEDWGPMILQMPRKQRNYVKKAFKNSRMWHTQGVKNIDATYARIISEASQL